MNPSDISWKTIDKFFLDNPDIIVKHHIDSYNMFFSKGIQEIFRDRNPIRFFKELDKETQLYKYECELYLGGINSDKIYYGKPIIYDSAETGMEREHYMYPNEARLRNMTYGFTIHYDVDVKFKILLDKDDGSTGKDKFNVYENTIQLEKIYMGRFPIMLQSNMCLLKSLSPEVRFNMGECRNDPGGYFIIDGKEKAIVSQEGRADNMLYVLKDINELYSYAAEIRSVSEDASKPIRTLSVRMVKEQPSMSNNQIVVNIPQVRKPVPLFIVMRALGIISDREIIQTCLLDMEKYDNYIDLFIPSVHDAGNIFSRTTALQYIATLTKGKTINHVLQILMNYFLPHIGELNFKAKALYLGYIVKRLLDVSIGSEKPTDRDSYAYKRIEVSGLLLKKLFREYYKLQQDNIYLKIDKEYFYKHNQTSYNGKDFVNLIVANKVAFFQDRIVETGFKKAFKGDWGSVAHTKKPGVVQDLNRLSFFGFLCQLRKTNLHIGADGAKVVAPRLLHGSQYGLLCPLHSPDGGNVGLHKHLSTSTHITSGCSSKPYINYLRKIGGGIKLLEECSLVYLSKATKVFVNGAWIGCTHNPIEITTIMKMHRRNGMLDIFTSIAFNISRNEIIISTDGGRPVRPLYYMMNNQISYERENVQKAYADNISWRNITKGFGKRRDVLEENCKINVTQASVESLIINAAVVEYLDTQEAETIMLAHSEDKRENYEKKRITHCEIHPSLILGLMANQIIFPHNNPYPRDAFSCGQAKQGVSLYTSNYQLRLDKTAYVLNAGQIPLTKSRYLKYATKEEHPYGENAIVAIMCYSGYNVEDAVIFNEASLKRGIFRTTYFNMYEDHEEVEKIGNLSVESKFMDVEKNNVIGKKAGYDYSQLDEKTGIIKENSVVTEKTILIGKGSNSVTALGTYVDNSKGTKKGQVGVVDKSFITKGEEGKRIAKVRIRSERIPRIGDKFCSRAGQKGTIGIILPEQDMPCTADGLRPDIIVNPHAMPSRMTIGHLVETITSKTGVFYGGFGDCTAFENKGPKHEEYGKMLTQSGFHSSGCEILYNGMTGEQLETEIYFGPTYYLRLKHMPKDKINYRARGPRTVLTRQTVQGRANDGGLRIGEMDRDCLIAHGMSQFINESMMIRGDEYYMAVCNKTGCVAIYNESKNIFLSPMADGPLKFVGNINNELNVVNVSKYGRDFSIVRVPYAFKLLMQELQAMNIQMRIVTEANVDQLMSLTKGDDLVKLTGLDSFKQVGDLLQQYSLTDDAKKKKTPESPDSPENANFGNTSINPFTVDANWQSGTTNEGDWQQMPNEMQQAEPSTKFEKGDMVVLNNPEDPTMKSVIWTVENVQIDDEDMTVEYIIKSTDGEIWYAEEYELSKYEFDSPVAAYAPTSPQANYGPTTPSPVFHPNSPGYIPESPDYSFNSPTEAPKSPDYPANTPPVSPDYPPNTPPVSPDYPANTPPEKQDTITKQGVESPKIADGEGDDLGLPETEKNQENEKILESVSSINKKDTEGLDKLSAVEEDNNDNNSENRDSGDKKKVIT